MSRNGSGQFSLVTNSWNPATNGQLASAGDWQALINDIAASITQSLSRDGQGGMTGNLPMGGNSITGLSDASGTGQALTFAQLFNQGTEADLASADTTDIGAQLTNFLRITGTTTITSFGTNYKGPRFLRFAGAVTLTNSTTLALPGGANITTTAGDCCIVIPKATLETADSWQVVAYQKNAVPGTVADGSITAAKIAANAVTPAKMANGGAEFGMRNRIINGAMAINQRGAFGLTSGTGVLTYSLDRFLTYATGAAVTISQYTGANFGSTITSVLQVTGATGNSSFNVGQRIEAANIRDCAGQSVTFSAWVYQATGSTQTFTVNVYTPTATDNWTSQNNYDSVVSASVPSGAWTFVSGTFTLNSTAQYGVGVSFGNFALGNGQQFAVGNVQLEKGSTATSFDYRPYGTELALCERYLPAFSGVGQIGGGGNAVSGTNFYATFTYRTAPRVAPTGLTINAVGNVSAGCAGVTADSALSSLAVTNVSTQTCLLLGVTSSAVLTTGQLITIRGNSSAIGYFTGCEL